MLKVKDLIEQVASEALISGVREKPCGESGMLYQIEDY